MVIEAIENMGLSNAEAKIYLALLEIGPSKTGNIIDKTNMQSSTIYHTLGTLIEKGVVTYVHQGKIKIFQATPPEQLLTFHEERKKRYEEVLPKLKSKEAGGLQKQTARVYKGLKGLQAAYDDVLDIMKQGEEYYFFQVERKTLLKKNVLMFYSNYHTKRSEKGIKVKGLAMKGTEEKTKTIWELLKNTKIKYVDEFLPTGLVVYKNKIIIIEWEDSPVAVTIESKAIADSYRKFFEDKWKSAKK